MKKLPTKPTPGSWGITLAFALVGVALICLGDIALGSSLLGCSAGTGIGHAVALWQYRGLTAEEQRESDRQEKDERNVAIREKAAYYSFAILYWVLAALCLWFRYQNNFGLFCLFAALFIGSIVLYVVATLIVSKSM